MPPGRKFGRTCGAPTKRRALSNWCNPGARVIAKQETPQKFPGVALEEARGKLQQAQVEREECQEEII